MSEQEKNPYHIFTQAILDNWKLEQVNYIKVEELSIINNITLFELIPDSELLDIDYETMYAIDSEDIEDMLIASAKTRFLVHEIYLTEDE